MRAFKLLALASVALFAACGGPEEETADDSLSYSPSDLGTISKSNYGACPWAPLFVYSGQSLRTIGSSASPSTSAFAVRVTGVYGLDPAGAAPAATVTVSYRIARYGLFWSQQLTIPNNGSAEIVLGASDTITSVRVDSNPMYQDLRVAFAQCRDPSTLF